MSAERESFEQQTSVIARLQELARSKVGAVGTAALVLTGGGAEVGFQLADAGSASAADIVPSTGIESSQATTAPSSPADVSSIVEAFTYCPSNNYTHPGFLDYSFRVVNNSAELEDVTLTGPNNDAANPLATFNGLTGGGAEVNFPADESFQGELFTLQVVGETTGDEETLQIIYGCGTAFEDVSATTGPTKSPSPTLPSSASPTSIETPSPSSTVVITSSPSASPSPSETSIAPTTNPPETTPPVVVATTSPVETPPVTTQPAPPEVCKPPAFVLKLEKGKPLGVSIRDSIRAYAKALVADHCTFGGLVRPTNHHPRNESHLTVKAPEVMKPRTYHTVVVPADVRGRHSEVTRRVLDAPKYAPAAHRQFPARQKVELAEAWAVKGI